MFWHFLSCFTFHKLFSSSLKDSLNFLFSKGELIRFCLSRMLRGNHTVWFCCENAMRQTQSLVRTVSDYEQFTSCLAQLSLAQAYVNVIRLRIKQLSAVLDIPVLKDLYTYHNKLFLFWWCQARYWCYWSQACRFFIFKKILIL